MTCGKCQARLIDDAGDVRCVNCGWRPGCPVPVIQAAINQERAMPRFTSEEHRKNWLAAMAKRRAQKAEEQAVVGGGSAKPKAASSAVPAVREPKTVVPRAVAGNTLSVIDAAIVQIREDVDALVRAREILARMQGDSA
jgi:hypothetical protein